MCHDFDRALCNMRNNALQPAWIERHDAEEEVRRPVVARQNPVLPRTKGALRPTHLAANIGEAFAHNGALGNEIGQKHIDAKMHVMMSIQVQRRMAVNAAVLVDLSGNDIAESIDQARDDKTTGAR